MPLTATNSSWRFAGTHTRRARNPRHPSPSNMKQNPTSSGGPNFLPVSNSNSRPTHLSSILEAASTAFANHEETRRILRELRTILHASQTSGAITNNEIINTLKCLGVQSQRAAVSAAENARKCDRLNCAFDSLLGEISTMSDQIEALSQSLNRSRLQRLLESLRSTWSTMCRDAGGISRHDWKAYRRTYLRGLCTNNHVFLAQFLGLIALLLILMGLAMAPSLAETAYTWFGHSREGPSQLPPTPQTKH